MSTINRQSSDVGPARGWHYGSSVGDVNTAMSASGVNVFRGLRVGDVGGGQALYLVRNEGDDAAGEQVTATAAAGETFILDFWRVGTDSDCGDFTAYE